MNLFSLVATLGLDTTGFSKSVGKAVDEGKKLGSGLKKAVNVVSKVAVATTLATATAYVTVVKKAVDAQADLEQNIGGSQTTWEGMARAMHNYATQAYEDVGLGTSQYLEMSTRMGNLLQGMGIDNRQAASMTIEAIQRTADVAAALNVPIEEAMQAVEGMSKGNFQMMDNLGVAMNETALNAYALEKGIRRGTKGMGQAEKIALAFEMYMDKSAQHAGTFARESEGVGGALNVLKASWQNFLDGSGDPEVLADSLLTYIDAYAKMVSEVAPRIWESFKIVGGNISGRIRAWVQEQGGFGQAITVGINAVLNTLGLPDVATIKTKVTEWWTGTAWPAVKEVAVLAFDEIVLPAWNQLVHYVTTWWSGVKAKLDELFVVNITVGGFNFGSVDLRDVGDSFVNSLIPGWGRVNGVSEVIGGSTTVNNITQNISTTPTSTSDLASQLNYNLRYGGGNRVMPLSVTR